jgi:hypothetical protein
MDLPDLAKVSHKSPLDMRRVAAVPTRYAMSKYAHAESISPAVHGQKYV